MKREQVPEGDTAPRFLLLFVCTGNVCRSPFAEILTRHLLIGRLGGRGAAEFDVRSAGVRAVAGAPMHPDSRSELAPWGLDGRIAHQFVARQLRSAMIERSDLILGASPRHRSAVVERDPAGLPITFSIREFARLADSVDPRELPRHPIERAHSLVGLARRRRGSPGAAAGADDVPDPIGHPPTAHRHSSSLIAEAVQTIVDVVAPRPDEPVPSPQRRPAGLDSPR